MSTLTQSEKKALMQKLQASGQQKAAARLAITPTLEKLSAQELTAIMAALKGTNQMQPALYAAKKKIEQARLHVRVPTKNPDLWPKVFRRTSKVSGVQEGKNHQHFKLNPTALPDNLNKEHVWNQSSQTDLIIIGPVSDIVSVINKASKFSARNAMANANEGSVNLQHDLKYGDSLTKAGMRKETRADLLKANPVPTLWVSCESGSRITNEVGQVVLDPLKELVELAGGAVSGFAGGFSVAAPAIIDILKTANDCVDLVAEPAASIIQKAMSRLEKSRNKFLTITVGIQDMSGHKSSIDTGRTSLDHDQLVASICAAMARRA